MSEIETTSNMTRQELYDEIKKTSKDSFILSEMKRLGYWDSDKPKVAVELIEKKVALQKELNALSNKIRNPESVIKEIHKKRMKEALDKREETKAKREAFEIEKKKQREFKKEQEIGFIGKDILPFRDEEICDKDKLLSNNLFVTLTN